MCWVPSDLKHRKVMVSKAYTRIRNKMEFVISIPVTYDEAVELDIINGNTYWQDATKKEINNVKVAFIFLDN